MTDWLTARLVQWTTKSITPARHGSAQPPSWSNRGGVLSFLVPPHKLCSPLGLLNRQTDSGQAKRFSCNSFNFEDHKGGRFVNHRIRIFLADSVLFSFYYSTPQFRQKSLQIPVGWQLNSTLGHKYLIMSPRREINHIVKYRKADTTPDSYSTRYAERNKETPFAEGAKSHQATPREILHKLHNSSCRNLSQFPVREAVKGDTWSFSKSS